MTETSQTEEMKRFVFYEMTKKEREAVEDRFFEDSDYFYALSELENDLVDSYARGELKGIDLKRFEESLTKSPERREQIYNARALQTLIAEETPAAVPLPSFWERSAAFFTAKMSVMQYATGALAILLACATGFLLYQNRQSRQEFARLQTENQKKLDERNNLQEQINRIQQEREILAKQLENTRGENEFIKAEDEKKQTELDQLKRRIENLPEDKNIPSQNPKQTIPAQPTLASVFLSPAIISRGVESEVKVIPINSNTKSVKFSLQIPAESNAETYSVTLDNSPVSNNLKPRPTKSSNRVLDVTLPVRKLGETQHKLTVGTNNYVFRLQKK